MKNVILIALFSFLTACSSTVDLGHTVQGDIAASEIGTLNTEEIDPFLSSPEVKRIDSAEEYVEQKSDTPFLSSTVTDQNIENLEVSAFKDIGYQLPGETATSEYTDVDLKKQAREFSNLGEQTIHIAYYKNNFDYKSPGDIINRTVSNGYQHGRFGPLLIRNDHYIFKTFALNGFYSLGAGMTFSRGKGIFSDDGSQSSTTFKLWEIPVDLGLGIEIPLGPWMKLHGVGGMSGVGLHQTRDDFADTEKGKRKIQLGYGPFAEGSLRLNLSRIFPETGFKYFSESELTNLTINASMRYQNYSGFKEDITISGTSLGIGFGFEFL